MAVTLAPLASKGDIAPPDEPEAAEEPQRAPARA